MDWLSMLLFVGSFEGFRVWAAAGGKKKEQ